MEKRQKDLILECAVNICKKCSYQNNCFDDSKCNTRMTLKGLAQGYEYIKCDESIKIDTNSPFRNNQNPFAD